ncbi:hypothetical protein GOODEAATRI_026704, partial [Goodea atripinnis]
WLLRDGSMRVRTTHPGFTQAVNTYFDKLIPKMVPLQPNSPSMVMEYWTGWYDAWGDLHHVLPPEGNSCPLC